MNPKKLSSDLTPIVGEEYVTDSLYERRLYDHDIAPLPTEVGIAFKTVPDAVVLPKSTEEIAEIVKYAYHNSVPVIPRGASSWGYGGTIPTNGGLVVGLIRLNKITDLDTEAMTVKVGPGVRFGNLLTYLDDRGYSFPVYPSSAPSATVGGWLATGGIGIGSLKYGHVSTHVEQLTVVTPTGDTLVLKEDDPQFEIFYDSEGTLGIISEIVLKIKTKPELYKPILASFDTYGTFIEVVNEMLKKPVLPFFIEVQDGEYLELKRSIGIEVPDVPVLGLFVYEGSEAEVKEYQKFTHRLVTKYKGELHSDREAQEEWDERFYYMRIKKAGPTLLAGEVTFPLPKLQFVVDETRKIKKKHGLKLGIKAFVISKDTVLYMPMFLADERKRWKHLAILPVINEITKVGLKAGGGPYGIGIWNTAFFQDFIGSERMRELKARKKRLDPKDIMNPGKRYMMKLRGGIPLYGPLYKLGTSMLWVLKYF